MDMKPLGRTLRSALVADAPAMPQPKGNKPNWAGILADALAGAMGRERPYAAMMQQQRKAEQEEAQWTRRQSSELNQYRQKKTIDQQFDKPAQDDQFTRYLSAAGIDPASDAGKALYRQRVESIANPPRYMTGPNGEVLLVSGGGGQPAPAAPRQPRTFGALPPGAVPIPGGPTPPASGGFRR